MNRFSAHVVLMVSVLASGCGDRNVSQTPPSTEEPSSLVDVSIKNPTDEVIVVPWSTGHPELTTSQQGTSVLTNPGCYPRCDTDCQCGECPSQVGTFVRIDPHTTFTFSWKPRRYVIRACGEQSRCRCMEVWPLTLGQYDVEVSGFSHPSGGRPVEDNDKLVLGAAPSDDSRTCKAAFSLSLSKHETANAAFVCH